MINHSTIKKDHAQISALSVMLLLSVFIFSSSSIFVSNKITSHRIELVVRPVRTRRHTTSYTSKCAPSTVMQGYNWLLRWSFRMKIILKLFNTHLKNRFDIFRDKFSCLKQRVTFLITLRYCSDNTNEFPPIYA